MEIQIIAPYANVLTQEDFSINSIVTLIKENTLFYTENLYSNEIGTVHLKIPYIEYDAFVHKLLMADCYNSDCFRYTKDSKFVYISTSYSYYLTITNTYGSIKKYLVNEDNNNYVRRFSLKLIIDEEILDYLILSNLLKVIPITAVAKTFIAPEWWHLSYGDYDSHEIPGNEGIFLNNCLTAYSNYLKLPSYCNSLGLLTNSNARIIIVSGFEDNYVKLFKMWNTNNIKVLIDKIQKLLNIK